MIRSVILFGHIAGVLALFVGLALEWLGLESLRRSATRVEASAWVSVTAIVPRLSGIALALILASGFYLGGRIGVLGQGWLRASYAALVLMAIAGGPVARPRMRAIRQAAEYPGDRGLPPLRTAASDALLRVALHVRIAFGLAVLYLMIAKPDPSESVIVMALAAVLTVVTSVPRRQAPSTLVEGYQ